MNKFTPIEGDYNTLDVDELNDRPELAEVCYKIVEYWTEDYTFEELLEEFDVLPEEAFYVIVKAGLIDEDALQAYLNSDA